jgi:lipoate---protein ligase
MILIRHHNEGNLKPFFYFALEEYVMTTLLKPGETYFFTWEIKGVVVGKNQVLENEVNIEYCKSNGIDIYRRPTGGGCVYADEQNTMFSMVTARKNNQFTFKEYLINIVESLKVLGLNIEFSGRNDLLFEGKKISGNAFLQNKYGMLMHGTFLYNCDLDTMVRAITPSDEKLVSKGISSVRSRVTNMKPYLGMMTQKELIKHFEDTITTSVYELTEEDIEAINELSLKYEDKHYIYKKQPPFTKVIKSRIEGGMFEIQLDIHEGIIADIHIKGDYFDVNPMAEFETFFKGIPYDYNSLSEVLLHHPIEHYVLDAKSESFLNFIAASTLE